MAGQPASRFMETQAQAPAPRSGRLALAVVGLLFLAVYVPTFQWLGKRWSMGVWYHSHGFLVLPLALYMVWRTLRAHAGAPVSGSAWGFAFLIPAVLLQMADAAWRFEILSAVSLVLALCGAALLFLGVRRTQAIWFPLLLLGFMIPVPKLVAARVHLLLRELTAPATEFVLSFIGYDVVRDGTALHLPFGSVQIADACSGFNALLVTAFAGCMIVYLGVEGWWRRLLVLAAIFPAALLSNILRCVVLVVLIGGYDMDILKTWVHDFSGICTFVVALLLLLGLEALLKPRAAPGGRT